MELLPKNTTPKSVLLPDLSVIDACYQTERLGPET